MVSLVDYARQWAKQHVLQLKVFDVIVLAYAYGIIAMD
jgi:hypothetical protein